MRGDDVRFGQSPPKLVRDRGFVGGIPKGEEQTDSDRLRLDLREGRKVELLDQAVRTHPLADGEASLERDEGTRVIGAEAIEMRAVLAPEMEHVLEPGRGHKRRAGTFPL